jgi:hypothetical protein
LLGRIDVEIIARLSCVPRIAGVFGRYTLEAYN